MIACGASILLHVGFIWVYVRGVARSRNGFLACSIIRLLIGKCKPKYSLTFFFENINLGFFFLFSNLLEKTTDSVIKAAKLGDLKMVRGSWEMLIGWFLQTFTLGICLFFFVKKSSLLFLYFILCSCS